jgi:MoaA/NifB/PqqE/SkfB family radical SAM enzyme
MFDYKKIPGIIGTINRHRPVWWRRMTPARIFNICLAAYELQTKKAHVRSRPFLAKIEASSACNLRCDGCRTGNAVFDYTSGNLKVDNFEIMMEKLGPNLLEVLFYLWGEPLINKNLPKLVDVAHRWNVSASISTNVHFLKEEISRGLIECKLDKMVICIDGLNQEAYGQVRKGGNLKVVMDNAKRFMELRREAKASRPLVEWQFIVTDNTVHDVDEARRLAKEWGVDRFVEIVDWSSRLSDDEKYFKGLKAARYKLEHASNCYWLWTSIAVQYDGIAYPCCHTANKKEDRRIFGSLLSNDLESVWNGPKYLKARRSFNRKKYGPGDPSIDTICDHCETPPVFKERVEPVPVQLVTMNGNPLQSQSSHQ